MTSVPVISVTSVPVMVTPPPLERRIDVAREHEQGIWNAYGACVSGALKGSMRTTAIYIPPRP